MSVVLEGSILEIGERFLRESEGVVPTLYVSELKESPSTLTVKLLARYRFDLPLFFQEMVSKWLYPGKRFPLETFSSCKMDLDGVSYQYIEGVIKLESMGDYIAVEQNLPVVKRELELGLRSLYHARQILELKGITNDEKLFFMQDKLTRLVHRFPERFDYDIFSLLQKFVLSVSDEYKRARSYHALLRIVYVNYSLFQKLLAAKEERPEERHLYLKVTRVAVDTPFGQKNVLGLFIGLNFLKENEFFEKRHLLKAVKKYFPGAHEVADSFFAQSRSEEKVKVLYMEIEKESG